MSSLKKAPPPVVTVDVENRAPRLGRLGPLLALGAFSWAMPSAASGIVLPALLATLSESTKVTDYALISSIGAVVAMITTVLAGALSDRTVSRWGRRSPWMVGGALVGGLGLFTAGTTSSLWIIVVGAATFQLGLSAMLVALGAVLPDRVPRAALGKAAALTGLGYLVGTALGGVVAAPLVAIPSVGLRVVPWTMLVAMVAFVIWAPDSDARKPRIERPRISGSLRAHLREFLPPADRDYWLAFIGRFLVIFALFVVVGYQLYIATDMLGLPTVEAASLLALCGVLLAVCAGLSTMLGGAWSDRVGARKPFVAGAAALIASGSVWFIISPSVAALIGFFVVSGIGYGIYLSVDQALMVEVLPGSGGEAKELGFLSLGNTAPIAVAPLIGGAVVAGFGYRPLFVISACCAAAGATAILAIRRVR
jgi:MFS family permease